MIYTNKGFEIKTTFSLQQDEALSHWFNQDDVIVNYNDYLNNAQVADFNAYQLIALKSYMTATVVAGGYHCFHVDSNLNITKQFHMDKAFDNFESWFERDETVVTPFKALYKHYVEQCGGKGVLGKINFSRAIRDWCGNKSQSKLKMINGSTHRSLTGIKINTGI